MMQKVARPPSTLRPCSQASLALPMTANRMRIIFNASVASRLHVLPLLPVLHCDTLVQLSDESQAADSELQAQLDDADELLHKVV